MCVFGWRYSQRTTANGCIRSCLCDIAPPSLIQIIVFSQWFYNLMLYKLISITMTWKLWIAIRQNLWKFLCPFLVQLSKNVIEKFTNENKKISENHFASWGDVMKRWWSKNSLSADCGCGPVLTNMLVASGDHCFDGHGSGRPLGVSRFSTVSQNVKTMIILPYVSAYLNCANHKFSQTEWFCAQVQPPDGVDTSWNTTFQRWFEPGGKRGNTRVLSGGRSQEQADVYAWCSLTFQHCLLHRSLPLLHSWNYWMIWLNVFCIKLTHINIV